MIGAAGTTRYYQTDYADLPAVIVAVDDRLAARFLRGLFSAKQPYFSCRFRRTSAKRGPMPESIDSMLAGGRLEVPEEQTESGRASD